MSITVSTDVFCDRCSCWDHGTTGPDRRSTAARRVVAGRGWTRRRLANGCTLDLCPECSADPEVQP